MDQEDQGDHNRPWWTTRGFYILLMSRVVAGTDRVKILSVYQREVYNVTKYQSLRLSWCNKLVTISQIPSIC